MSSVNFEKATGLSSSLFLFNRERCFIFLDQSFVLEIPTEVNNE